MRITIEIEVPGAEGDKVSLTTSPGSTASGQTGNRTPEPERDAGSPPASVSQQYAAATGGESDETGWTDAGPAPEPPALEGNSGESGDSDPSRAEADDVGGPPQPEGGNVIEA